MLISVSKRDIAKVVIEGSPSQSLGHPTCKDQPLLDRRDALLLFNPFFDALHSVSWLNINLDLATCQCLDLDRHPAPEPKVSTQRHPSVNITYYGAR
jgi:hypothetical protein